MSDSVLTPEFWQSKYENEEVGWDRGGVHPALVQWIEQGALEPCQIVVPGCGYGHEVLYLVSQGFLVTAIDYAVNPIERLKKQLDSERHNADLHQVDLFEFQPRGNFDAVYEQTCLCALNPKQWSDYESRIFGWLRQGGQLFVLFMQTGRPSGPPFDCPVEEMRDIFSPDRWLWADHDASRFEHPRGEIFELATILTRR